jgi:hypothetical protein
LSHAGAAVVFRERQLSGGGAAVDEDLEQPGAGLGRLDSDTDPSDRGVVPLDRLPVELGDVAVPLDGVADPVPEDEALRLVAGLVGPAQGDDVSRPSHLVGERLPGIRIPHTFVLKPVSAVLPPQAAIDLRE